MRFKMAKNRVSITECGVIAAMIVTAAVSLTTSLGVNPAPTAQVGYDSHSTAIDRK